MEHDRFGKISTALHRPGRLPIFCGFESLPQTLTTKLPQLTTNLLQNLIRSTTKHYHVFSSFAHFMRQILKLPQVLTTNSYHKLTKLSTNLPQPL